MVELSNFFYEFPDIEDALELLFSIDSLTEDWKKEYPDHRYEYIMYVNKDQSISFLIRVFIDE